MQKALWTQDQTERLIRLWPLRTAANIGRILGIGADGRAVSRKAAELNLAKKPSRELFVWTDERNAALKAAWPNNPLRTIGLDIGTSHKTVRQQAIVLGLPPKPRNIDKWTADQIDGLKKLLSQREYSATEIAVKMGMTKGAIIGKSFRLGLLVGGHGKAKAAHKKKPRKAPPKDTGVTRAMRATARVIALGQAEKQFSPPSTTGVKLVDLERHHCRWPFGESPNLFFCGHDKFEDRSYCLEHCRIAYETVNQRIARAKERLKVAA